LFGSQCHFVVRSLFARCRQWYVGIPALGHPRVSSQLSPDQWQQLESLIDALLDTPHERRAALLVEVTDGNAARRAELEQLVADCERAYPLLFIV